MEQVKTLQQAENEIIDEFSMFDEWLDKYEYLIELGKALKDYPEDKRQRQRHHLLPSSVQDGEGGRRRPL